MYAMSMMNKLGGSARPVAASGVPLPPDNPPGVPPGIPIPDPDQGPTQPPPDGDMPVPGDPPPPPVGDPPTEKPMRLREEIGGPKGPEPTRYGDWERKGRVSDF